MIRISMRYALFLLVFTMAAAGFGCSGIRPQGETAVSAGSSPGSAVDSLTRLDGSQISIDEIERRVPELMEKAVVPGLSMAVVSDGKITYLRGFGVKANGSEDEVGIDTAFSGLSFSKTVTSYLTLRLVDRGVIDLDVPLVSYLPRPLPEFENYQDLADDRRVERVTARQVLSHTTGWPNWRWFTDDGRLAFVYSPGERFSYSGEGFAFLQMVIEEVTGEGFEALARAEVFDRLAMPRSSFVWNEEYEENFATDHDHYGHPMGRRRWETAGAAGSLETTAEQYATFLIAAMEGRGLSENTRTQLLAPQVLIEHQRMFGPLAKVRTEGRSEGGSAGRSDDRNGSDSTWRLAWGLGWGLVPSPFGTAMFHTGNDRGSANYHVAFPDAGKAIVLLANSNRFESIAPEIVRLVLGDHYSPFEYLGYEPYDSPVYEWPRRLVDGGFAAGMAYYDGLAPDERAEAGIEGEEGFLQTGRDLLGFDRPQIALQTYREMVSRFGDSASALEGVARSHLALGDPARAAAIFGQARSLAEEDSGEARDLRWLEEWAIGQASPIELPAERLAAYEGDYGPRHVVLRDGALYYFRDGADAVDYRRLLAISTDTFVMAEIEEFRLRFESDETGTTVRIIGLYQDGDEDVSERTVN